MGATKPGVDPLALTCVHASLHTLATPCAFGIGGGMCRHAVKMAVDVFTGVQMLECDTKKIFLRCTGEGPGCAICDLTDLFLFFVFRLDLF